MMDSKVDQDVREAAIRWGLKWDNYASYEEECVRAGRYDDDELVRAFAELFNAGRQSGLREAAEVARKAQVMREQLHAENNASINAHKAVQAEEIADAITALSREGN